MNEVTRYVAIDLSDQLTQPDCALTHQNAFGVFGAPSRVLLWIADEMSLSATVFYTVSLHKSSPRHGGFFRGTLRA